MEMETKRKISNLAVTIPTKVFLAMIVFAVMLLVYLLFTEAGKKALWEMADEIIKRLFE